MIYAGLCFRWINLTTLLRMDCSRAKGRYSNINEEAPATILSRGCDQGSSSGGVENVQILDFNTLPLHLA